MRLLVSVVSATEARRALAGGADIIDVKDPAEGALGAPSPRVLSEVVAAVGAAAPVSVALGDDPGLPHTAALAARGAELAAPPTSRSACAAWASSTARWRCCAPWPTQ